jgi:magnesium-transporting ATPase (P-type)
MWYIIILIIVAIISFILGYKFALMRYYVKELMEVLSIVSSLLMDEITAEDARERMKKITEKFK